MNFEFQRYNRIITVRTAEHGGDRVKEAPVLEYTDMNLDMEIKYKWFFRLRTAQLQIKYPKYFVQNQLWHSQAIGQTLEQITAKKLKKDITTCRRMISKHGNAIERFKKIQNATMFPNWQDPDFLRVSAKLETYKETLTKLTQ
jgi:hypothetical protein